MADKPQISEARLIIIALIRGLKFTVSLLEKIVRGEPV